MIEIIIVILFSLSLGSFGNNVISHFISGRKLDILYSTGQCCHRKLNIKELIPILSFLIQKGKCKGCGELISRRYMTVEVLALIIGLTVLFVFGFSLNSLLIYLIAFLLLLISVIDYYRLIIPNKILLALLAVVILFLWTNTELSINGFVISFSILAAIYLVQNVVGKIKKNEVMGMGDLKLIFVLSLLLDLLEIITAIWISSLIAITVLLISNYKQIGSLKDIKVPFGIYLSIGFMVMFIISKHSESSGLNLFMAELWK